jgi:cytochrome c-type biogenesis protein CcmH
MVVAMFAATALAACAFAVWPIGRTNTLTVAPRALLSAAVAALVLGIGMGLYLFLGAPALAVRSIAPATTRDVPGLVAALAETMRHRPRELSGWILLGRGYLSLNDPQQAAVAFRNAEELAPATQKPGLLSSYGEALTLAAGQVTPEAEAAFRATLAGDPKDFAARFYLGDAYAARRDAPHALAIWRTLLADSPPNAPWRGELVDRMAALAASSGGGPNVEQMVKGLAAHLRADPADASGWQRLVRAYAVLGREADSQSAFAAAQIAMKDRPNDLAALAAEAKALKLGK